MPTIDDKVLKVLWSMFLALIAGFLCETLYYKEDIIKDHEAGNNPWVEKVDTGYYRRMQEITDEIRNAGPGENSKHRIAGVYELILDHMKNLEYQIDSLKHERATKTSP